MPGNYPHNQSTSCIGALVGGLESQAISINNIYIFSSEGALYVILPYDYPQQPLFEHTPVLNNNFEYWCRDDFVDCDFYDD